MKDKDAKEFFSKLSDLMKEYSVDINVDIWSGYDGGGLESVYFEDMDGKTIGKVGHNYIDHEDIKKLSE